jgi:hypothetical protein
VTLHSLKLLRIEEGLVADTWRNADDLGRLVQLGARFAPADK